MHNNLVVKVKETNVHDIYTLINIHKTHMKNKICVFSFIFILISLYANMSKHVICICILK